MANAADDPDTCAESITYTETLASRHGAQISPDDDPDTDDTCSMLNKLSVQSAAATSYAEDEAADNSIQSRKHKRKQREPRRISNADMPQTVKTETVESRTEDSDDLMGRPVGRCHDGDCSTSPTCTSNLDYPESDDDTNLITYRTKFRPIMSPGPADHHHEIDPFEFPPHDNEDEEDIDIGVHESMSGGSNGHGSPTSEDGDLPSGNQCHSFGRGSKKNQRSYKNLSKSRRIVANARERNRVHTISAAFEGLRRAVPSYSHNQKLSKLAILRIACSYILALAKLADKDYTPDEQSELSFGECVDMCTKTLQSEGRSKRRKVPLD